MPQTPGCVIIYRWRLKPGKEAQFRGAWERVTRLLVARRGALGSRLHTTEDGLWLAYAQWPSREAREASVAMGAIDPDASALMDDAVESAEPPIYLTPVADHLG